MHTFWIDGGCFYFVRGLSLYGVSLLSLYGALLQKRPIILVFFSSQSILPKQLQLQCVGMWCSVLQCVAVWCIVFQCVAVCCSVL